MPEQKKQPTRGLRLVFEPGITGLKFVVGDGSTPYPEDNGTVDMAYINWLIETDELRQQAQAKRASSPGDLLVDMGDLTRSRVEKVPLDGDYEAMVEDYLDGFNHIILQGIPPMTAVYAMSQAFALVLGYALRANLQWPVAQKIITEIMNSASAAEKMVRPITTKQ